MAAISSNGTGGGNWSNAASWVGAAVPAEGDNATIVAGDTITVDQNTTVGNDTATAAIAVNGGLDVPHNVAADYILTLKGDLKINSGGEFNIADSSNSLDSARKFTVETNYSGALAAGKYGLLCNDGGKFRTYGTTKSMETTLAGDVAALGTQITVQAGEYAGWKVGDQITIAVTSTSRGPAYTEMRTIQAIDTVNHIITLTAGVTYAHTTDAQVCLLSHNIILTSFNAGFNGYIRNYSQTKANFHIDYTELTELGANVGGKNGAITFYDDGVCGELPHVSTHHNWIGLYIYTGDNTDIGHINAHANEYGIILNNYTDNHTIGTINCSSSANYGVYLGVCRYTTITTINSYSNSTHGVQIVSSSDDTVITTINSYNNDNRGVYLQTVKNINIGTINSKNHDTENIYFINTTNSAFGTITTNGGTTHSMHFNYCTGNTFTTLNCNDSGSYGILLYYSSGNVFDDINITNSTVTGFYMNYSSNNLIKDINISGSGAYGLLLHSAAKNIFTVAVLGEPVANTTSDLSFHDLANDVLLYSDIIFTKSVKLVSVVQVTGLANCGKDSFIACHNIGAVSGAHKKWIKTDNGSGYGIIESENTIYRTEAPSVRSDPADADGWIEQSFNVPAVANNDREFSIYMRDDAAFNGSVELEVRFKGETIVAPVAKTMTTSFVEQTITAPAVSIPENGVLELVVKVKGTAGYVYADDFTWS